MNTRVVAFREEGTWVAQCLDIDVCVSAPNLSRLWNVLDLMLFAERHLASELGQSLPGPAPLKFHELWANDACVVKKIVRVPDEA